MEKMRDSKGRFLPGAHPTGRQKGSSNKINAEIKERFLQLVESYDLEQMRTDLMALEPAERLRIVTGLLDFFIPKMNRTDHTIAGSDGDVIIVKLPTIQENDHRPDKPGLVQPDLPAITE